MQKSLTWIGEVEKEKKQGQIRQNGDNVSEKEMI